MRPRHGRSSCPASARSTPSIAQMQEGKAPVALHGRRIRIAELVAAAQVLDFRNSLKRGEGTEIIYGLIRERVRFLSEDRVLYPDIQEIIAAVEAGDWISEIEARVDES